MPGFVLHSSASIECTHKIPCATAPVQTRVLVGTFPAAVRSNLINVAPGCPFQVPFGVGTKPQPCITVEWANVSTRVLVMGQPLLLQAAPPPGTGPGSGVCKSAEQIPQGVPLVNFVQSRVIAT